MSKRSKKPRALTPRQLAYAEFLKSDFWKDLSRKCKDRDGNQCVQCRSQKTLNAHHLHYDRPSWYDTQLVDLITLCHWCHQSEHGIKVRKKSVRVIRPKQKRSRGKWLPRGTHVTREQVFEALTRDVLLLTKNQIARVHDIMDNPYPDCYRQILLEMASWTRKHKR